MASQPRSRISIIHTTVVHMPRPGDDGAVALRVEACTSWAPSTERDRATHTDIWCGNRKLTVALAFAEVDRILAQARAGDDDPPLAQ
jgi:hypothetical protein